MAITKTMSKGVDYQTYVPNQYSDFEMIGKIAQQVIRNVNAKNPLAMFDKMPITNGDTIEQVVVGLVQEKVYDQTGANALNRIVSNNLAVRYFDDWTRTKFDYTIDIAKARKVMQEGKSATDLTEKMVASLVESDVHSKFVSIKELLKWGATASGGVTPLKDLGTVYGDGTNYNYKAILKKIKDTIKGMQFVNDDFNSAGFERSTEKSDIYIAMPYTLKNAIDVDELAGVFNLDKAEIRDRIIELDTTDDIVYIVDQNAILVYTRLYEMADQKNADGLFWNYFLHVERLYAISPLFDGCFFKVDTATQ